MSIETTLNPCAARAQAIQVATGYMIDAAHLFNIDCEGRPPVLERRAARTLQPTQVSRCQLTFQGDSIALAVTNDGNQGHRSRTWITQSGANSAPLGHR
jgi:hypothetical protein